MNALTGEILTLPKMSGSVSTPKSLSGNVGAKTINIGGKGDDGATFTPSVSADGIISWTNDKDLPNPEPVNIKGTKGDKGDKGDRGQQGVQGVQGERGEQGQKGDKGDRGEQGVQGVQGAKGETGAQGQKGADGTPATHRWSGTTLYITSASGTSSANLKGDKGDPGTDGKDGADGYTPIKGTDYFTEDDVQEIAERAAEMVDIPEGGGTGGVTSWNDLTDKPFGETFDYSNLIHSSRGEFKFALLPDGRYSSTANVGAIGLVVGKSYRVEVSYMLNMVYCKFEGVCVSDFGNLTINDGVNSCSFNVMTGTLTINCIPSIAGFENVATSSMLFVNIYEGTEDIVPLDEKYIPDTIARVGDIPTETDIQALIDASLGVIENGTY